MSAYRLNLELPIKIVVEPDGESFHAYCPQLRNGGIHVDGASEVEALSNAQIACALFFKSVISHEGFKTITAMKVEKV